MSMGKGGLFALLMLFSVHCIGAAVELSGHLQIIERAADGQITATPVADFIIRRGNFEYHATEGSAHFQGVPWSVVVDIDEPTSQTTVTAWLDHDGDRRIGTEDEALLEIQFDARDLASQSWRIAQLGERIWAQLAITPRIVPERPEPVRLTGTSMGLSRFCLKHAKVLMDDSFVLGSLTGFGQKVVMDVPGRALVSMSLEPLYDWEPIGHYEDGQVRINLSDGHQLSVAGVRIGPEGSLLGGPFVVFGAIEPSKTTLQDVRQRVRAELAERHSGDRLQALLTAFQTNPFGALGRITIGNAESGSEALDRYAGTFGDKLAHCGEFVGGR